MLFAVLAHEELLHLEPARIPPCNSHQKWIRSRAACKSGGFGIKEEPLRGVSDFLRRTRRKQSQRRGIQLTARWLVANRLRKPSPQPKVLAEARAPHRCAQTFRQASGAFGNIRRHSARRAVFNASAPPRRLQRRNPRKFIVYGCAHSRLCPSSTQPLQNRQRRFLRPLAFFSRRPHARRAPCSQEHAEINSCVRRSNKSCTRYNGSLNPIPPGYA